MQNIKGPVPVFWWSETRLMGKSKENYGDLLSKYIVESLSEKDVKWIQPKKRTWFERDRTNYFVCGSILSHVTKKSVVWGSGIIDEEHDVVNCDFKAVRGPRTRSFLESKGYTCPEVYGDPALILPILYYPKFEKKFKLGIIPHYNDYKTVYENYKNTEEIVVIDLMTLDVEEVTTQIIECERIISSSLHGIIVSHAYQIPAIWVEFSKKIFGSGIKYIDYLESVDLPKYQPTYLDKKLKTDQLISLVDDFPNIPEQAIVKSLQKGLLDNCPFINDKMSSRVIEDNF